MKRFLQLLLIFTAAAAIAILSAVCWHALQEIHYLKSFYPAEFTVEEAFYAGAVELIKVVIIGFPLLVLIAAALFLLTAGRRCPGGSKDSDRPGK